MKIESNEFLVTLNIPPALEGAVLDCLLKLEVKGGFNSFNVYAHDHDNKNLSIAEQVSGRKKQIRFQIYLPEPALELLKQELERDFSNSGIRYRVLPVLEHGYF